MKKKLVLAISLTAGGAHGVELKPWLSLKDLFSKLPIPLQPLSADEKRLRSAFDSIEGGIHAPDAGLSLVSSESKLDGVACQLSGCQNGNAVSLSQQRNGLSWNLPNSGDFYISPRAEVVRYQWSNPTQNLAATSSFGMGVGVDSLYKLSDTYSAYASAGMMQMTSGSAYEGLFGVRRQFSDANLFMEARWADMNQTSQIENTYDFSNLRIGISHQFKGL
ncbi:MAG: hypothetical protein AABY68_06255 [Pseudomonadota bacterium]